jgi:hypothetical protein
MFKIYRTNYLEYTLYKFLIAVSLLSILIRYKCLLTLHLVCIEGVIQILLFILCDLTDDLGKLA